MRRKTKKRLYTFLYIAAGIVIVAGSVSLVILYEHVTALFLSRGFPSSSIVYASPSYLKKGMGISMDAIQSKLNTLGYHQASGMPYTEGTYSISGNEIYLYTKKFPMPGYTIDPVNAVINISDNRIADIFTRKQENLDSVELEPEVLATFFGDDFKMRIPIRLSSLQDNLINAVIVTEDVRFFEHGAIDVAGIARAFIKDVLSLSIKQGGSTITQQLVKNLFLNNRRTFKRKFLEAVMSIMLAGRFSKAQILNAYLNDIYLGQDRYVSIVGIGAAAKYYFSKNANELTLSQCAMLAGLIASPGRYSPVDHPAQAIERRNFVLKKMLEYNVISSAEYESAIKEPLDIVISHIIVKAAPYFVDYISDQLETKFSKAILSTDGLRVFTTLDMETQLMAEKALDTAPRNLEGAITVIQPQTGYVTAMIGGRNYSKSPFNRAVFSERQIGSSVKPFIYMLAFSKFAERGFSQASIVNDEPMHIRVGKNRWEPRNYDRIFRGKITVRYALQHSINIPAVKIGEMVGLQPIADTLGLLGLGAGIQPFPSIVLGSISTSPLDLCLAYTIFSNHGYEPVMPIGIKAITDTHDKIIYKARLAFKPIGNDQACYIVNNVLLGSETEGTGKGLRRFHIKGDVAGKTGTTNDFHDAWFVGYTPDIVADVWLGYDNDEDVIGEPAAKVALPVVGKFLSMYTTMYGGKVFDIPSGIKFACVDKYTGMTGSSATACVTGAFIPGTEPKISGIKGVIDWLKRIFK